MIVLITGGRHYKDRDAVYRALNKLHATYPITGLIHGCAAGVDTFADDWAKLNNVTRYPHRVPPHEWEDYGRAAGVRRNSMMLMNDPRPQYCVSFPGGTGTADMTRKARSILLTVWQPY